MMVLKSPPLDNFWSVGILGMGKKEKQIQTNIVTESFEAELNLMGDHMTQKSWKFSGQVVMQGSWVQCLVQMHLSSIPWTYWEREVGHSGTETDITNWSCRHLKDYCLDHEGDQQKMGLRWLRTGSRGACNFESLDLYKTVSLTFY